MKRCQTAVGRVFGASALNQGTDNETIWYTFAGTELLSAQDELWNIEKTRRARRTKMLNIPDDSEIILKPVGAADGQNEGENGDADVSNLWQHGQNAMRTDSNQERAVLGALNSIEAKLEHGAHRAGAPDSARDLWQAGGEQKDRSSFWNSVGAQQKARREALFRVHHYGVGVGPIIYVPAKRAQTQASEPQAAFPPKEEQEEQGPEPIMSIETEKQRRRADEHFQKTVTNMMSWNSNKMKEMVQLLRKTREKIRVQREVRTLSWRWLQTIVCVCVCVCVCLCVCARACDTTLWLSSKLYFGHVSFRVPG